MQKIKVSKVQKGFSIVEVIVAILIFVMFAASSIVTLLSSLSSGRLASEQEIAQNLALQGIEAVESIRNQSWENFLNNGNYGIDNSLGYWRFNGSSDLINNRYSRVITLEPVERDANGDIVASGGVVDPDTKKITSTVSWKFTSARNENAQLVSYLTNWQTASGPSGGTGPGPTVTPGATPTLTPPPLYTCTQFCISQGYVNGACARNAGACSSAGYSYVGGGDIYCTGGPSADTCCCF